MSEPEIDEGWALNADEVVYISLRRSIGDTADVHIHLTGSSVHVNLKYDVASKLFNFVHDRMRLGNITGFYCFEA